MALLSKFLALVFLLSCVQSWGAVTIVRGLRKPLNSSTLNTSLISYWKLDETSGTRVDSEATSPNDLTDNNTVTQSTGKIGNDALFTSSNSESLTHADSADLSVGDIDFSVTCWVKFTTVASDASLVSHYEVTGNQRAWRIVYNSATGRMNFTVSNDGSATTVQAFTALGAISSATWYFLYVAHDSVNNLIKVSGNDGTVDSTSYSSGVKDSTGTFNLGKDSSARYLNGELDEVGFWKKVLTAAEVTELYNSGSGKTCCPF